VGEKMCPRKQKKTATAEKAKRGQEMGNRFFEPMKNTRYRTISAKTTLTRTGVKGSRKKEGEGLEDRIVRKRKKDVISKATGLLLEVNTHDKHSLKS